MVCANAGSVAQGANKQKEAKNSVSVRMPDSPPTNAATVMSRPADYCPARLINIIIPD